MASVPSLLTVADVGWPEVHRSCRPIDVGCRVIPGPKSAWIGFGAVGYTSPPQTLRHPASPRPLHQPFTALGAAPTCYATASQTLYPTSASLSPQLPNLRTVCKKYLQFYDHLAPLLLPALYPEGPRGQARVGGASGPAWPVPEQMEGGRGAMPAGDARVATALSLWGEPFVTRKSTRPASMRCTPFRCAQCSLPRNGTAVSTRRSRRRTSIRRIVGSACDLTW